MIFWGPPGCGKTTLAKLIGNSGNYIFSEMSAVVSGVADIKKQLTNGLKGIKKFENIIVAYEPVWSIGTGIIPKNFELSRNINNIKKILTKLKKSININILYGGSVNPKNAKELAQIKEIKGFLIGGASLSAKKFIDIIKKSIN